MCIIYKEITQMQGVTCLYMHIYKIYFIFMH